MQHEGYIVNSKRSAEFEERLLRFGLEVIRLVTAHKTIPSPVVKQIIRSSTSIGASYAEAQNGVSRADFKNKITISKKEAAETRYRLRLVSNLIPEEDIDFLLEEIQEVLLILQKIVNTLRARPVT